ncbi:hypothetical protein DL96DRAFT_1555336 [Flagelloscypha sp. PMI_526]|nr:hypothetical protein DL96DRAFT_1555336 [Flagelloscypha sp. PMI_526]
MRSVPLSVPNLQAFVPLDAFGPSTGTGLDEWRMLSRERYLRPGEIALVFAWPGYMPTTQVVSSDGSLSGIASVISQYVPGWLSSIKSIRGADRKWDPSTIGASTSNLRILRLWTLADGSVAPEFALSLI